MLPKSQDHNSYSGTIRVLFSKLFYVDNAGIRIHLATEVEKDILGKPHQSKIAFQIP